MRCKVYGFGFRAGRTFPARPSLPGEQIPRPPCSCGATSAPRRGATPLQPALQPHHQARPPRSARPRRRAWWPGCQRGLRQSCCRRTQHPRSLQTPARGEVAQHPVCSTRPGRVSKVAGSLSPPSLPLPLPLPPSPPPLSPTPAPSPSPSPLPRRQRCPRTRAPCSGSQTWRRRIRRRL